MPKYVTFFNFKGETWDAMMSHPSDRAAAVREMAKSVGGTMEAYYLMSGTRDGFIIVDAPDTSSVAAVSIAVASTGVVDHLETHELIAVEQVNALLEKAKKARAAYRPPGR
jgi:uncharacterized protein with GYD domain